MINNIQLVIDYNGKPTTTSQLVADKLEKRHADVLRTIRDLECSDEFRVLNYIESTQKDAYGRDMPITIMTRDGFSMLMMSLKGGIAAKFREEFIAEFNRMEEVLRYGETPKLIPTYQMRILSEPAKSLPHDKWSVFTEAHGIMLLVESNIGSVNKFDLVDGSIGAMWAKYRKGKEWAVDTSKYLHEYEDVRGARECLCYQMSELQYFREWLSNIYKKQHLYRYLYNKYKKENNSIMLSKVESVMPRLLAS